MKTKIIRRAVHGIILLNKPQGLSSNAAMQKVRWLYRAKKGGHTGALDPLATGLLPICLGEATKFSQYGLEADKSYQTTIKLGSTSTTGDAEGEIIQNYDYPPLTLAHIEQVLMQFNGALQQIPPMYSALKHQGQTLYQLARQGIEVERAARSIHIYSIELKHWDQHSLSLTVHCSKGTYIRTLGEDIAKALGCGGGYLTHLHRIKSGQWSLDPSIDIAYLEGLDEAARDALLKPIYEPINHLTRITLDTEQSQHFMQGRQINIDWQIYDENQQLLVFAADQQFLGLGYINQAKRLQPKKVMNYAE